MGTHVYTVVHGIAYSISGLIMQRSYRGNVYAYKNRIVHNSQSSVQLFSSVHLDYSNLLDSNKYIMLMKTLCMNMTNYLLYIYIF